MSNQAVKELAQFLVQARDEAIKECDRGLDPKAQDVISKRWRREGMAPREIIPDAVDAGIMSLLYLVDQGLFPLYFKASDGTMIDLRELGDLCALYATDWKQQLSTQRRPDDFDEMRKAIEDKFGPKGSAT